MGMHMVQPGQMHEGTGRGCRASRPSQWSTHHPVLVQVQQEQRAAGEALVQAQGEQQRLSAELERTMQEREGLAKEGASLGVQLHAAQRDARDRAQEADGLRWVSLEPCDVPSR